MICLRIIFDFLRKRENALSLFNRFSIHGTDINLPLLALNFKYKKILRRMESLEWVMGSLLSLHSKLRMKSSIVLSMNSSVMWVCFGEVYLSKWKYVCDLCLGRWYFNQIQSLSTCQMHAVIKKFETLNLFNLCLIIWHRWALRMSREMTEFDYFRPIALNVHVCKNPFNNWIQVWHPNKRKTLVTDQKMDLKCIS